jgi:amino-acid N-acetyltransferase
MNKRVEAAPAAGLCVVRKASLADIGPLLELINGYAAKGVMLPRTEFDLCENIRDFSVAYEGAHLVGCGALHFYSPQTAEVRSLAVDPEAAGRGVGRKIVEALAAEAVEFDLDAIFAFTYVTGFFARLGFEPVERGLLPLKAWKDCSRCPKFQSCDEIAVLRVLNPGRWEQHHAVAKLEFLYNGDGVVLPVIQLAGAR